MIRDLTIAIIRDGKVPAGWKQSFIVCLSKGKSDALDRGNYSGLRLTEQAMKVIERIADSPIRPMVTINRIIVWVRPRQRHNRCNLCRPPAVGEIPYSRQTDLYHGEKAFNRDPRKVIWWVMRKLGVEEWIVKLVQGMFENVRSRVRVGEGLSDEFELKVGVHQGSVPSPLLFIVLEALSREFRAGVPW